MCSRISKGHKTLRAFTSLVYFYSVLGDDNQFIVC